MTDDPRTLLAALRTQTSAPTGFEPAAWDQARGWIQPSARAPAEDVVRLPPPLALAVLEAAVEKRETSLPAKLAELGSGGLAKAARRALYRLKSAGVAPPAPEARPGSQPRAEPPSEGFPSLLSPMLGDGERAMVVARTIPGGVATYEVTFSDEKGLLHLSSGELARGVYRKHLKALRDEQTASQRASVVEIPYDEARSLLAQAAGQNRRARTPLPAGADAMLRRLEVDPQEERPPLPAPLPDDARLALEGAALHQQPEIQQWLPPEAEIRSLALALDALATSPLQLSEAQRTQGIGQRIQQAAEKFFTTPVRQLYARRLWAMADHFQRSGREPAAELARAVARRLFHDETGIASPFTRLLFEKILRLSADPGSAPAPAPEASPPPSPGGLILKP